MQFMWQNEPFCPVCRSTRHSQPPHRPLRRSSNVDTSRINQIDAEPFSMPTPESPPNGNDDDYLFTLDSLTPHAKTPIATMKIVNKNVQMILDTGASTDILDKKTFDSLTRDHRVTLQPSSTRLFAYGSNTPLRKIGKFETLIESRRKLTTSTIHVTDGQSGYLLSYQRARELGLIALHLNALQEKPLNSKQLRERYPDLFQDIGKLKDFQVKLHIDTSIPLVVQKAHRLPFHMRKKVATALETLERQDIIEHFEGAIPYVSTLVVIPKEDSDVRLCIDIRLPNKAIQRERHPSLTVVDLINSLNGATIFSKLDLRRVSNESQK